MRTSALASLDRHGAVAPRLGWTAEPLFGGHPEHGVLRVVYAGTLMVNDRPAIAVEPNRIVFDRFCVDRTKPGQTWGPPVWEFAAKRRG